MLGLIRALDRPKRILSKVSATIVKITMLSVHAHTWSVVSCLTISGPPTASELRKPIMTNVRETTAFAMKTSERPMCIIALVYLHTLKLQRRACIVSGMLYLLV